MASFIIKKKTPSFLLCKGSKLSLSLKTENTRFLNNGSQFYILAKG